METGIPNLTTFGASGVDLFFVISGFVMAQSLATGGTTPSRFLAARWRRIVPLFVLMSGVYILLCPDPIAPPSLIETVTILPLFDGSSYHAPALFVGWTLGFEAFSICSWRRRCALHDTVLRFCSA